MINDSMMTIFTGTMARAVTTAPRRPGTAIRVYMSRFDSPTVTVKSRSVTMIISARSHISESAFRVHIYANFLIAYWSHNWRIFLYIQCTYSGFFGIRRIEVSFQEANFFL
jgi:hypothetical protein